MHKRFGQTEVLRGCDLQVARGERVAIIGPNGAGKSTVFNLISGRLAPSSGQVHLNGQRIDGLRPHLINRLGLARSFQVPHLFPQLSVFENLRCGALWSLGYRYNLFRWAANLHDANARAADLMQRIRLDHKHNLPAQNLTHAEQRALEVGITLAGNAPVLLLDEPTAGMGRSEARHFVQLIREVTAGKTLLMVEHDMDAVFGLADRIAVLVQGQVLAFDTPEAVRADARVQAVYLGALMEPARC